jgi:hypothetical protein
MLLFSTNGKTALGVDGVARSHDVPPVPEKTIDGGVKSFVLEKAEILVL